MNDVNIVSAKIVTIPKLPIKGVYYIGQYGTSGYASAAKGYLYHYFSTGIPITWDPLYFDNSKLSDDNIYDVIVKSLIRKPIVSHDTTIIHSTPDLWPMFWKEKILALKNKIVIGYCTWETNVLPKKWVECINQSCNEVWCPSKYNETVFQNCNVTVPIRVVPHVFLHQNLPSREEVRLVNLENNAVIESNSSVYTFYTIGELISRKGIEEALIAFCNVFTKSDPVRFIIKTHIKDYSDENIQKCKNIIEGILNKYTNPPNVICILNNISNSELLALHAIGDCYVSLTKSEGFGLTIFDAFNYNKKIITTGYSGHLDFLGQNYPGLVTYKLGQVEGMETVSENYTNDQIWAIPNIDHAQFLMKLVSNI